MLSNLTKLFASAFFALPAVALVLVLLALLHPAKAQTLTPLHDFVSGPQHDGLVPRAGLVMDRYGNLYGTTVEGGANGPEGDPLEGDDGGDGTVFKVTPGGTESVIYSFGASANDGILPASDLVIDRHVL
jgi:hypothetical protein